MENKMPYNKSYIIMDAILSGRSCLGLYFYKYNDDKFIDSFFFSFYGRYRFEDAEVFLGKITSFVGKLPLITDKKRNYYHLNRLYIENGIEPIDNERLAINDYVHFNNIKKAFARSEYQFESIEDAFIENAKNVNSLMTKQLFEGKLMHILSFYRNIRG